MKVIHIVAFLLCIVLITQSFLTACPTPWGLANQEKPIKIETEDKKTEKINEKEK